MDVAIYVDVGSDDSRPAIRWTNLVDFRLLLDGGYFTDSNGSVMYFRDLTTQGFRFKRGFTGVYHHGVVDTIIVDFTTYSVFYGFLSMPFKIVLDGDSTTDNSSV